MKIIILILSIVFFVIGVAYTIATFLNVTLQTEFEIGGKKYKTNGLVYLIFRSVLITLFFELSFWLGYFFIK